MGYSSTSDLNEALRLNLTDFIEANRETDKEYFKARKEISIARYALQKSLEAYHQSIQFFDKLLATVEPSERPQITATLDILDKKSRSLIEAVHRVTATLKLGADIEEVIDSKMDAVQVYSIIAQIPALLHSTIHSITHNPELSQRIVEAFQQTLDENLAVLSNPAAPQGILEAQVVDMLNSVPLIPHNQPVINS